MFNLSSNAINGEYKNSVIDKTMTDIYNTIKLVYGPYGTDLFIKKNTSIGANLYYTRDGKEVALSLNYNMTLANDIKTILFQAIDKQARLAGDGTTTLILFLINLYRTIMKERNNSLNRYSTKDIRNAYNSIISELISEISKNKTILNENNIMDMLLTCTQDEDLSKMIKDNLYDDINNHGYIMVDKSDFTDDISITRHENPFVDCSKIFSTKPIPDSFELSDSRILYVDGLLDLSDQLTIEALTYYPLSDTSSNIIIICSGVTEITKTNLRNISHVIKKDETKPSNNIIIMKLNGSHVIPKVVKEDLAAYIYNIEELSGIVNNITFEAHLVNAFMNMEEMIKQFKSNNIELPANYTYEVPTANIDRLRITLGTSRNTKFAIGEGLYIGGEMNEMSKKRYTELRENIRVEKSNAKRAEYIKRLKGLYAIFTEVKIGSQLIKDSQRKYELLLDAIISAQEGANSGVLNNNSLLEAINATKAIEKNYLKNTKEHKLHSKLLEIIKHCLAKTFGVIIENSNKISTATLDDIKETICKEEFELSYFDIETLDNYEYDEIILDCEEIFYRPVLKSYIVEPFAIIENILNSSVISIELALSDVIVLDDQMGNYI